MFLSSKLCCYAFQFSFYSARKRSSIFINGSIYPLSLREYLSLFLVDASEAPKMQEEDKKSTLLTAAKARELEKKVTKVSDFFEPRHVISNNVAF